MMAAALLLLMAREEPFEPLHRIIYECVDLPWFY